MSSWPVVKLARNVGGGIFLRNMAGRTHDEEETYIPVSALLSDEIQEVASRKAAAADMFNKDDHRKTIRESFEAAISAASKEQESAA